MSTIQNKRGGGLGPPPQIYGGFISIPTGSQRPHRNAAWELAKAVIFLLVLSAVGCISELFRRH